jgi:hypothetical protein
MMLIRHTGWNVLEFCTIIYSELVNETYNSLGNLNVSVNKIYKNWVLDDLLWKVFFFFFFFNAG